MAYRPSLRSHNKVKEIPLDIRPVMNLMVVLIPILLYSAEFVKLSIRELNLPPAASIDQQGEQQDDPKEEQKRLGLTVIVSKKGFYIGNQAGYLTGDVEAQTETEESALPTIPLNDQGEYDYNTLVIKLVEINEKIQTENFVDAKSIIISAEADVAYKHLIKLIDKVTVYENSEGIAQELFSQINIGQVI